MFYTMFYSVVEVLSKRTKVAAQAFHLQQLSFADSFVTSALVCTAGNTLDKPYRSLFSARYLLNVILLVSGNTNVL